jgi:hypothetical protein
VVYVEKYRVVLFDVYFVIQIPLPLSACIWATAVLVGCISLLHVMTSRRPLWQIHSFETRIRSHLYLCANLCLRFFLRYFTMPFCHGQRVKARDPITHKWEFEIYLFKETTFIKLKGGELLLFLPIKVE